MGGAPQSQPRLRQQQQQRQSLSPLHQQYSHSPTHRQLVANLTNTIARIQGQLNSISSQIGGGSDSGNAGNGILGVSRPAAAAPGVAKETGADVMQRMGELAENDGHPDRAGKLYYEAFMIKKRTLGVNHPSTVKSLSCYGRAMASVGSSAEALKALELVVKIKKAVLGDSHISTAASRGDIGLAHYAAGDYEHAVVELRRSLRSAEQAGSPQHAYMARPLVYLGNALCRIGPQWREEAQRYHQRSLMLMQRQIVQSNMVTAASAVQRLSHRDALSMCNGLADGARLLAEQEEFAQSVRMLQTAFTLRSQYLGPAHPETVALLEEITRTKERQREVATMTHRVQRARAQQARAY